MLLCRCPGPPSKVLHSVNMAATVHGANSASLVKAWPTSASCKCGAVTFELKGSALIHAECMCNGCRLAAEYLIQKQNGRAENPSWAMLATCRWLFTCSLASLHDKLCISKGAAKVAFFKMCTTFFESSLGLGRRSGMP